MAKYDVTYSCGHQGTETLFGPGRQREAKLEWFREQALCPGCFLAKKEADRAAAAAKAQNTAASAGLPPLAGTEKQCSWAETIRAGFIVHLERVAGRIDLSCQPEYAGLDGQVQALLENPADAAAWAAFADALSEVTRDGEEADILGPTRAIIHILGQVEARWWIDNRYRSGHALIEHIATEPARAAAEAARRQAERQAALDAQRATEEQQRQAWAKRDAIARRIHALLNPAAPEQPRYKVSVRCLGSPKPFVLSGPNCEGFASAEEAVEFGRQAAEKELTWNVAEGGIVALPLRPERLVSEVQVWDHAGDRRVYLGHGFKCNCVTYYHSGTHHYRPGSLVLSRAAEEHLGERKEELRAYLAELCGEWKSIHIVLADDGSARGE